MTFASLEFLIFFVLVLLLQRVLNLSMKIWVLLAASFVFYMSSSVAGVLLILATSAVDYHVGKAMGATQDDKVRGRLLALSLIFNLGILGFFKYSNFLLENLAIGSAALGLSLKLPHLELVVPPAISYFTFTSMSYVLDVYYERVDPTRSPSEYLFYVAYFPKLLAGPIVRAGDFFAQARERVRASAIDFEIGIHYFLIGAVKKVIADQMAPNIDLIFSAPSQYDGLTLLQGLLGYTVQIYCDFSGYSDMAIGCARMMGFRLPENFAMPYSAVNITEFWRRWHITLSNWFRDYVFIPLEMSSARKKFKNVYAGLNMLITMTLCGLWHGASWTFIVWGGLHGIALAVNRVWRTWRPVQAQWKQPGLRLLSNVLSRALTLGVVVLGWIFFRAKSWADAIQYFTGIVTWRQAGVRVLSPYIVAGVGVVVLVHLVVDKDRNWAQEIPLRSFPVRVAAYSMLLLMLSTLSGAESTGFLYFQF